MSDLWSDINRNDDIAQSCPVLRNARLINTCVWMLNVNKHLRGDQNPNDLDELSHLIEIIAIHHASCQKQRGNQALVFNVHIRTAIHQNAHDVCVIIFYCLMQRRSSPAYG